ncbi:hypothetical protein EMCG_02546 [[Emmonsia] crescens]|uniref:Uncharacterized protein n=1 Tax=[Emmonsia] crescens TaxID=73230 RepID=A0A0G2J1C8_9EURO|nr:hypothetical protein EMCG_02546 [Emmonsia crescens UAMH 3008]
MSVQTRVLLITRLRTLPSPTSRLQVCHQSSASMDQLSFQRSDPRILWLSLYPLAGPFVTAGASPVPAKLLGTHRTRLVDLRCVGLWLHQLIAPLSHRSRLLLC